MFCMLTLASCSENHGIAKTVEKNIGRQEVDNHKPTDRKLKKIKGTVRFSWETSEIDYQNERYFLEDRQGIAIRAGNQPGNTGKFYTELKNVCIEGYELSESDNQGNGFGPNGKYRKAFVVTSPCLEP